MRIGLVGVDGSIHIKRWSGWLRKHGHEVTMLSLTPHRDDSRDYDSWVCVRPRSGKLGPVYTALALRKKVQEINFDLVHGHYLTGGGWYASMSGAKHIIVSAWGSDIYFDTKDFLKRQCVRYALRHSDVVLGDSDHILREVKKFAPRADARKVIFGIDTELFKPNPIRHDKFRFLSIRATASIYNPQTIISAFEEANLDAELWLFKPSAGSFDVYDYVKARPELDKKVIWLDKKPYDKMPELYNSVDVGVSIPSWDSSSTAVNECMACGVPVIVSNIPQNHEWVDMDRGVFTLIDASSLAEKMALVHGTVMTYMSANARKKVVQDGDFGSEMAKAERIYQEVLDGEA
ncbi:MAG TPA: glycosyltransferase [Thermoplasmata archaeon]|jgi:glycosyltransferase involved in cell wall biosynthesis